MKKLIILSIFVSTVNLLLGQIINIPGDYPTIQQGINVANDGDTVLVASGIYFENINFNGKNITVASDFLITFDKSYISSTIINGNQNGSVIKFESDEDSTAILIGFTLINGYDMHGGGVFVDSAGPSLEYLNISFNEADYSGGGLYFNKSYSKLYNISVTNNTQNGIYSNMSILVMDSLVVKNNSGNKGGGIKCSENSDLTISNSTILDNTAYGLFPGGGGLSVDNSIMNLQNVTIANNSTLTSCAPFAAGGGIHCYGSVLNLSGVTIKNNEANSHGGGLCCLSSEIFFESNNKSSIYENNAPVGQDIYWSNPVETVEFILDTFSVIYPTDYYAEPCKYFNFDINHGLVQQIDEDLYVSTDGSNSNSGLTENEPLLNIQYALSKIRVDSLHPHQIHLLPGTYSPSLTQEYFPLNIPDYCQFIGSNATEVILDAELWGGVININYNNENDISGITVTGGNGGFTAGGIACYNSSPNLSNLIIEGNTHWNSAMMGYGGGLLIESSDPILQNVLIVNNYAWSGGGIYLRNSNPHFSNCTFSENLGNSGRGIYITGNSNVILKNTIMWSDSLGEIRIFNNDTTYASLSISWSDIHGGLEGIDNDGSGTVYWLEGNLNEDPQFDIGGDHPYALTDQSPCIDAGTPDTTGLNLPVDDIRGNFRIWDGDNNGISIIDMGGFEYGSVPVYIKEPLVMKTTNQSELKIFPNPLYQSTTFELVFEEKSKISLSIHNQLGEKVETIFNGEIDRGIHQITWNLSNLPSGIYFVKLQTDQGNTTQKMIKK